MPVAIIVGAVIAAAGAVTGAVISSADIEDAQNEAKGLAMLRRKDELKLQSDQKKLAEARIRLSEKGLLFEKGEARKLRGERALERGMAARESHYNKIMGLVNTNDVLKTNFLNRIARRAG